jgi:hypothetical protein
MITVEVVDTLGATFSKNFVIAINDQDEFDVTVPVDSDAASNVVLENASNGTTVGVVAFALDEDDTNYVITYSLDNAAEGRFAIDANTGLVTVADGSQLNYEDDVQHEIVVRATSVGGSSATRSFVIQLNDVDEFDITSSISDLDSASDSVNENAAIGTSVGIRANAYDLDGTTNTVTYSLDDDAGGRFAIDSVSGVVTTAAMLDFEAQSSWGITVQALSEDGSTATSNFTVAVLNVFERPVGIAEQYVTSYIDDLVLTGTGLLANDFDPDGDAISAVLVSGPGRGSLVSFLANGGLRYTPERGFLGTTQ